MLDFADEARARKAFRGTADAQLEVKGPYDRVEVTGAVAVRDGVINAPEQNATRRATNLDDPTLVGVLDTLNAPAGQQW